PVTATCPREGSWALASWGRGRIHRAPIERIAALPVSVTGDFVAMASLLRGIGQLCGYEGFYDRVPVLVYGPDHQVPGAMCVTPRQASVSTCADPLAYSARGPAPTWAL